MAKIKMSAIGITAISGTVEGSIFSHNRGGKYVKNWAKPLNPQSPAQTALRSNFRAASKAWGWLDETTRDLWRNFAKANPVQDVFGDSRTISGFNQYVMRNQNNMHSGLPALTTPPEKVEYADFQFHNLGTLDKNPANYSPIQITGIFQPGVVAGDITLADYVASFAFFVVKKGSGVNYGTVKNQMKFRIRKGFQLSFGSSPFEIFANINHLDLAFYGDLEEGDTVIVDCHIHTADGFKSSVITKKYEVIDTP